MLDFAVLGLLYEAPMHGYELRKQLGTRLGGFRAFSYGSLYPALRRIGCHLVQGYLFTEPLAADEFADWWREALAMSPQPYSGQLEHLLL